MEEERGEQIWEILKKFSIWNHIDLPETPNTHRHMDSNVHGYPKPPPHFYKFGEAGKRFSFLMDISASRAPTSKSSLVVLPSHGWCEAQFFVGFYSPSRRQSWWGGLTLQSSTTLSHCFPFPPPTSVLDPLPHGFLGELQFFSLHGGKNSALPAPSLKLAHLASSGSSEEQRAPIGHSLLALQGRWVLNSQLSPVVILSMDTCLPRLDYELLASRAMFSWSLWCPLHLTLWALVQLVNPACSEAA